jgi:hypothetical protein
LTAFENVLLPFRIRFQTPRASTMLLLFAD